MLKKIIITLLFISPVAIFTIEVTYPRPKTAPPQALVGAWETEAEIRVNEAESGVTSYRGKLRVSLTLYEDGTVEGTVGDAAMQNAYFRRNRGWLFKLLNWATDYIIVGDLNGSVIGEAKWAEFNIIVVEFDKRVFKGEVNCYAYLKGGRKKSMLSAPLILARVEQP